MNNRIIILLLLALSLGACKSKKGAENTAEGKGVFKQKKLVGMTIMAIDVKSFPRYGKDGEKWDSWAPMAGGADLYVRIKQYDRPIYTSEVREECDPDMAISFFQSLPLEVKTYTERMLIEVFDKDGISDDDNVGYFTIYPLDYQNKPKAVLTNADGSLRMEVSFTWKYE
ncbi:MAG: hypothetical protein ACOVOO_04610 [Flavobacteriales bacterium]|jgi:hypothetical protein